MPFRLDQMVFDCAVYLYPDDDAARSGADAGGSGFLITRPIPGGDPNGGILWVVTNRHVVEDGAWTVRVNTKDGGFDVIDTNGSEWIYHPDGDDLAICPIALSGSHHSYSFLTTEWLLTEDTLQLYDIGPGDPSFMVGRFVGHDGKVRNTPTARFGQIAQLPEESVVISGRSQKSFLVELRSIAGFSGSPVFVYLDSAYYRPSINGREAPDGRKAYRGAFEPGPWLLGVEWGMVPNWDPVCDPVGKPVQSGQMVPSNSGMAAVVPAWRLHWLLCESPAANLEFEKILVRERLSKPSVLPTEKT